MIGISTVRAATGFLASLGVPTDTVGDRVTLALKRSGRDDAEVAEEANVTAAWLSAVKNDRIKTPPLDKLRAVALACRVPLSYLTEPLGVVPIEDVIGTDDWLVRMRVDPDLRDGDKTIIEELAARLRESKA